MVEFPLVARRSARGFAAPVKKSTPDTTNLLTLILRHQTGVWLRLYVGN
jgi:hypothetical protein